MRSERGSRRNRLAVDSYKQRFRSQSRKRMQAPGGRSWGVAGRAFESPRDHNPSILKEESRIAIPTKGA